MTKPKPKPPAQISGAAKKVTARMLADLWDTPDEQLDRFRKTRRPGADTWDLDHLRQARDLLDLLGYAVKSNDGEAWAQVTAAWERLQEPTESPSPPAAEGASEAPATPSTPAKPAVADPAPPPPPPEPSTPGAGPRGGIPRPPPPPTPAPSGSGVPLGVERPLRPMPKLEDPDLTLTPELQAQGPALPFTEPTDPPPVEQLPAPAPEEWEPGEEDYGERGTAVGFSLEDIGPALPFGEGAAPPGSDAGNTRGDQAIDDEESFAATSVAVLDDEDSYAATSVAVLGAAAVDPSVLNQVIRDADETLQLDSPRDRAAPPSATGAGSPPASKTEPEPDAATTEYETLSTLQGHMPPSLGHLHRVTLEQYASLVAECEAFPDRVEAARGKLGLRDEYQHSALEEIFKGRFAQDPTIRSQWEQLRARYRAWFEREPSK